MDLGSTTRWPTSPPRDRQSGIAIRGDVRPFAPGTVAVFLDRDAVINDLAWDERTLSFESPYRPQDVRLAPGALEGLAALRSEGVPLIVASNQPAAAKGTVTLDGLRAVHERVVELLAGGGIELDEYRYCFHHPEGVVPELSGPCECRKPSAGLLIGAAREHSLALAGSWLVGDADSDVKAGRAAGCRTMLVEHPRSSHRRSGGAGEDARAPHLAAAALVITKRLRH